jgi:hypothetical protein
MYQTKVGMSTGGTQSRVPNAAKSCPSFWSSGFCLTFDPDLDHVAIKWSRIMISSLCLNMIFSENRLPLFRIML